MKNLKAALHLYRQAVTRRAMLLLEEDEEILQRARKEEALALAKVLEAAEALAAEKE